MKRRAGPVASLFVLFGLFLNVAGAGPVLARDGAARLGNGDTIRSAALLRTTLRSDEDSADRDGLQAALPPAPRVVTFLVSAYPVDRSEAARPALASRGTPAFYLARAPPAA